MLKTSLLKKIKKEKGKKMGKEQLLYVEYLLHHLFENDFYIQKYLKKSLTITILRNHFIYLYRIVNYLLICWEVEATYFEITLLLRALEVSQFNFIQY